MRVLMIGALAVIFLCIFIGILIYDRRIKNDKHKLLTYLWNGALDLTNKDTGVVHTDVINIPVPKLKLINQCKLDPIKFGIAIKKLVDDEIIINKPETLEFTTYGAQYYDFVVLPKLINK